jgi:hypothetical protein
VSVEVTLRYRRVHGTELSSGRVASKDGGLHTDEGHFEELTFNKMISRLSEVTKNWPDEQVISIVMQRTDREGLLPVTLDAATAHLIRTDPLAAIAALSISNRSPSGAVKREVENRMPIAMPPLPVGDAVLANAFGDQLYFKVRGHELECPGCGFWGVYAAPSLLNHPDRKGASFKTVFACSKRCGCKRILVTCNKEWGYVDTTYLLEQTTLNAFYFPRAWNGGRPWVTRDVLQQLHKQYLEEKERAACTALQINDPQG